jgi:hypothetical protein
MKKIKLDLTIDKCIDCIYFTRLVFGAINQDAICVKLYIKNMLNHVNHPEDFESQNIGENERFLKVKNNCPLEDVE